MRVSGSPLLVWLLLLAVCFLPESPARAEDPRSYDPEYLEPEHLESEYLLSPWYRGEAMPGLIATILPNGHNAPLVMVADVLKAMETEYHLNDDGSVQGRRHPGDVPFEFSVSGQLQHGDAQYSLAPEEYRWVQDELYVSTDILGRVYPFDLEVDERRQRLTITAHGPLPMDLARERERRRNRALGELEPVVPPQNRFPYKAAGRLAGDVNLDYYHRNQNRGHTASGPDTLDYDGLLVSELAYNTALLFFRGDQHNLDDARFRLGQSSPQGNAWGIPGLASGFLGDVNSAAVPLVGALSGRGAVLSSYPLDRPDQFDQTTLEGDAPPGWEVELYRGAELLFFGQVGADGRYRFDDVPLLFGQNAFRLVFIGPQGQVREQTRDYTVGSAMASPGQTHWRLFAGESHRRLLEPLLSDPVVDPEGDRRVFSLEGEVGLGRYASAGLFASRAPGSYSRDAPLYDTQGASVNVALPIMALELDAATQKGAWSGAEQGTAWGIGGSTALGALNLTWRRNEFDNFYSRRATYGASPVVSESRVRANLPASIGGKRVSLFASGERWSFSDDRGESTTRAGARFRLGGIYFNQELEWRRFTEHSRTVARRRTWLPGASVNKGRFRLSLNSRYDLDASVWRNTQLLGNWRVNDTTNVTVTANRLADARGESDWAGSLSVSRDFHYARVRALVSRQPAGGYLAGLGINLSFGMNRRGGMHFSSTPWAERGAADVRVFHDRDHSGDYDPNQDQLFAGAAIQRGQQRRELAVTDERGRAFVGGLNTRKPLTLRVVPETIPDPFLTPAQGGVTFTPRPGQPYPAEVALVDSGEITGRLIAERNGLEVGLAGVTLELQRVPDEAGKVKTQQPALSDEALRSAYIGEQQEATTARAGASYTVDVGQSQYDGSFLFDLVPPGQYRVGIKSGQAIDAHTLEPVGAQVRISPDNLLVSADLKLLAPDDKQRRPEVLEQRLQATQSASQNAERGSDDGAPGAGDDTRDGVLFVMGSYRNVTHARDQGRMVVDRIGRPLWLVRVTLNDGAWYRVMGARVRGSERERWGEILQETGTAHWALSELLGHYEIIERVELSPDRETP